MKRCIAIILCISITFITGCATVMCGPNQKVSVSSDPTNAVVNVDGTSSYETPTTVNLARKTDHTLIFTKEGYRQERIVLMHVISGAVAGNILAGGLIGWGVDAMTGSQFKLVPETVHVVMRKAEKGEEAEEITAELTPEEKLEELKRLFEKGLIDATEYEANKKVILHNLSSGTKE